MRNLEFHRLARRELRSAAAWYAVRSEQASCRFLQSLYEAVDRMLANPEMHAVLIESYRYVRVKRYPYMLIYEEKKDDSILVVAVAHTSRKPGYWRRRK